MTYMVKTSIAYVISFPDSEGVRASAQRDEFVTVDK